MMFNLCKILSPDSGFFPFKKSLLLLAVVSLCVNSQSFAQEPKNIDVTTNVLSQINIPSFNTVNNLSPQAAPTVRFAGLRQYSRVFNQSVIPVQASNDLGITRIEFYVNGTLTAAGNVTPVSTNAYAVFVWSTAGRANGKYILQAKAFDTTGGSQTATAIVVSQQTSAPTGSTITLLPLFKHQTMDGWEATAEAGQLYSAAWNNYKNALFDQAVNDLGINRIRLEIKSGAENPTDYFAQWRNGQITEAQYNAKRYEIINDNSSPTSINPNGFKWSQLDHTVDNVVIPLKQRLAARGERLHINVNYVDFGVSVFEHTQNAAEYAEFVLATYQHLQSRYGFVPDSWEVILEPDNSNPDWTAQKTAQAIKAAGDLLVTNGFTPSFVAPSTVNAANAPIYIDQIINTPGAMNYIGELTYHRYCCAIDPVLLGISQRAVAFNKKTAMLEWIGADYNTLHQDIKQGRNSSWQQFTLAGPLSWGADDGSRYYLIDDSSTTNPVVQMASRTRFLRQYFRYIRAGAQRIEALSGNANFDPLAFINQNGKYVVVVKAAAGGTFNIQGLPAGSYGIKYTTASQYNVDLPNISINAGQPLSTNIPGGGVITIYAL